VKLGTLGGGLGRFSVAYAVSESGHVVGVSNTIADCCVNHAFSWTAEGGMVDLGTLGFTESNAWAVNASGQVVGIVDELSTAVTHGFSWTQEGGMVDIGTLGGDFAWTEAVNDHGQVVGWSSTGRESHAFSWTQEGGMVDLGTLGDLR
jgi:probable HAF family extracellular repeat protein